MSLKGKEVDAAGDNRRVASLKIGRDREGAGGENHLQLVRQQRLHPDGAALQRDVFGIQSVFLEDLGVIGARQNGVDGGAEAAVGGAKFLQLGQTWIGNNQQRQYHQQDKSIHEVSFVQYPLDWIF